jgi:hypothetical protein
MASQPSRMVNCAMVATAARPREHERRDGQSGALLHLL